MTSRELAAMMERSPVDFHKVSSRNTADTFTLSPTINSEAAARMKI